MKKLKPLNDQIILKPIEETENKVGNIIIPDSGREKPELAEVIEVSEGIYNYHTDKWITHQVKKGDIVVIPKMGVQKIDIDGQEYYICQANQLMAKIEENE
jgi:chaperonin GroES